MKKTLCIVLSVIMLFSAYCVCAGASGVPAASENGGFGFSVSPSKTEYEEGEDIEVGIVVTNFTPYKIGEIVTWVEYSGDVCLSPVTPEVDTDGGMVTGGSFNPGFTLRGEKDSPFMRTFYRALMCITRNFVVMRQRFRNMKDCINPLSFFTHRQKLGTCTVKYCGKDVELSFGISYVNLCKCSFGETDLSFSPISADEVCVNDDDRQLCRNWFTENIINAGANGKAPAYNFSFGNKTLRDTLSDWTFKTSYTDRECEKYRNGSQSEILFSSEKYGLSGRVEAVIYEESATCEWTVYLQNTKTCKSAEISRFNAVEADIPAGKTALYASLGSSSSPGDFTLFRTDEEGLHDFTCREGRSSDYYMPYFNISGENYGVCLGIGWSGQWEALIDLSADGASVSAKQETLDAVLESGETIRSPLVSLTFYKHENPVKGFNIFRSWVLNSLLPEKLPATMLNVDAFFVSPVRTSAEMLFDLKAIPAERYENIDNIWMDAGWYCRGEDSIWNDRFGVWESTENRFPGGIKEISDFAAERDSGLVLWYEEERLSNTEESKLYSEGRKHGGWIIGDDKKDFTTGLVWNFGNPEALDYIEKFISASLKENGVTVYREDSNFDPLSYWKYGDKHIYGGRNGICENHYVDGHYRFIDFLFEDNEGLNTYDCCASGGRRLDLEVIRRGVPLWRSDYNCDSHSDIIEATQSQTYGISFWLPYSGTYYYTGSDYRSRSTLYQGVQVFCGDMANERYEDVVKYRPEREMMNGGFYPVAFGGTAPDRITAMQYGTKDKGFAVIYKRAEVADDEFSFSFSGLDAAAGYSVYDYDSPENISVFTGAELMNSAFGVSFAEGEQAVIIEYEIAQQ